MFTRTSFIVIFIVVFTLCINHIHSQPLDVAGNVEDLNQVYNAHGLDESEDLQRDTRRTQTIPTGNTKRQIQRIIAKWSLHRMDNGVRSGSLVSRIPGEDRSARIDNQSPITKFGRPYYNVQVQLGTDTYSTVFIPAGVTLGAKPIRNAFVRSSDSGRPWIFVPTGRNSQKYIAQAEG
jgi:hypothetical protein